MAGLFPSRHPASGRVSWPRGLQRAAFLLAASVALFWSSVAFGRWMIPIPDSGPIYGDLLIAWVAVLVHISAWPNLWAGLRDLRAREPNGASILVAWRAFLLTVVVIVAAVVLQNPGATAFAQAWSLGSGILPAAALAGYVLIALGMTAHLAPATSRFSVWSRRRPRGSSTERSLQVFR